VVQFAESFLIGLKIIIKFNTLKIAGMVEVL